MKIQCTPSELTELLTLAAEIGVSKSDFATRTAQLEAAIERSKMLIDNCETILKIHHPENFRQQHGGF